MRNWLLLLLLAACWAPSFLFIKLALIGGVPPLLVAAGRVSLAAVILMAVLLARGNPFPGGHEDWRRLAPMALLSTAIPFALINVGEQYADSGMAAILNGTTPIFTVILAQVFLHDERLTGSKVAGVLIGFAGIVVIFGPQAWRGWTEGGGAMAGAGSAAAEGVTSLGIGPDAARVLGLVAFTLAGACYGAANVYARRHLTGLPPLVAPALQMTLAGLCLTGLTFAVERPLAARPDATAVAAVLALGVFGTALAYIVYYPLLVRTSATFVSLVTYLLPPAGVALGMAVLGERPGWNDLAGCGLIVLGVMVVNRR